jgi:tetratricopeptide (TPR) repeat protein
MAETHRDDIAKLETLYAENPEGRVFIHLAEAYRRAGDLDRALEVVKDGISRYAEDSSAHVVLGRVLQDRQEDDEAAAAFRRVMELDAHNLVALRGLGDLAFRSGDHDAALEYFERLAELEPPDGELEALIDALRSGPAGMEEALRQWGEVEGEEAGSQGEVVDFSGGTLEAGGAMEPEVPVGGAVEPEVLAEGVESAEPWVDRADEAGGSVEPAWEPDAGAPMEPDPVEEEASLREQSSAPPREEEPAELPEPWASDAGEGAESPSAVEAEEPELPTGTVAGLQPEDALRGMDGAGQVEALEVTERDFHEEGGAEGGALETVGAEELEMAEPPVSGEPSPDATWGADDEAEQAAAEATQTVFTETMAQVYARQGLYDRAADVYRELLRQRPGDPALETRLAEMQEMGGGAGSIPEVTAPEESFPFLDAAPTSAAGLEEAGPAEEVWEPEYAWETESAEEPASGEDAAPAEAQGMAEEAGAPETGLPPEAPEAAVSEAGMQAAEWASADVAASEGETEYSPEAEHLAEPPSVEAVVEDVESAWTGAGGAAGSEETPYSWTEPEPGEAATGEGIRSYLLRLAGWSSETGDAGAAASTPEREETQRAQENGTADTSAATHGMEAKPSGEDDDLDMFRAWLESLKR